MSKNFQKDDKSMFFTGPKMNEIKTIINNNLYLLGRLIYLRVNEIKISIS